jgi:hypothetical protein
MIEVNDASNGREEVLQTGQTLKITPNAPQEVRAAGLCFSTPPRPARRIPR